MEIGLTGAPSSGKSTFFKAATLIDVKIASYPFTTIEPNVGITFVTTKCPVPTCSPRTGKCVNGMRFVPVKLWDIAGLVPGAHEGKGLGNKFLDNVRQADVLLHIFDTSGKTNAEGGEAVNYNPEETIRFLEDEIDQWFGAIFDKEWKGMKAKTRTEFIEAVMKRFGGLGIKVAHIEDALNKTGLDPAKPQYWEAAEIKKFGMQLRGSSKPLLLVANKIDLPTSDTNYQRLKSDYKIIPCAADAEYALRAASEKGVIDYIPGSGDFSIKSNLNPPQQKALEFIKEKILKKYGSTGVQQALNEAIFKLLDHIVVYPVEDENKLADGKGNILPDAILLPRGSTPRDLARKVHSTMADKFITAVNAKTKRQISGEYELQDGDILKIVFGR